MGLIVCVLNANNVILMQILLVGKQFYSKGEEHEKKAY